MSGEGSGKKGTGFKQESRVSQQYNIMYMLYDIMYMLCVFSSSFSELAFIVGGYVPGREGRERIVAPYAIDKELIGDPVFSEFARAACPFMMPGIYPQDPEVCVSSINPLIKSIKRPQCLEGSGWYIHERELCLFTVDG